MRNHRSRYSVPTLVCVALLISPIVAFSQENPLTGRVSDSQLSGEYRGNNKSDNYSNVEYTIINASGTAHNALGTIIQRGNNEFKLTREVSPDEATYDAVKGRQYDRHIYVASKKQKIECEPTYQYDGEEIYVAVDYRKLPPPPPQPAPPPPTPPTYYEAYVAQVKQGVCPGCKEVPSTKRVDTQRWEFKKVSRSN